MRHSRMVGDIQHESFDDEPCPVVDFIVERAWRQQRCATSVRGHLMIPMADGALSCQECHLTYGTAIL